MNIIDFNAEAERTREHLRQKASERVTEKAHDLLEENRVILQPVTEPLVSEAIVAGASGHYSVVAEEQGITCSCDARDTCSHILAAMIAWAEEGRRLEEMPW